mgnify:CR=1 FL=1
MPAIWQKSLNRLEGANEEMRVRAQMEEHVASLEKELEVGGVAYISITLAILVYLGLH